MKPLVAVLMITYNHEKHIGQAIQSVVEQKTSFPFKLFIGEDCSIDKTREICVSYQTKYPDKIQLLLNKNNLGMMSNFFMTHKACVDSGAEYIALCEGDDCWTSAHKLQKQVDYMRSNRNCAGCFHPVQYSYLDEAIPEHVYRPRCIPLSHKYTTRDVLLRKGRFFATASVIFRTEAVKHFPEWFYDAPVGDYPLMVLAATKGEIGYIDDIMCVHLKNVKNSWSDTFGKSLEGVIKYRAGSLKYLNEFNDWTNNVFRKEVKLMVKAVNYSYLSGLVWCAPKSKQLVDFFKLSLQLEIQSVVKILFKIICPKKIYGGIKKRFMARCPF
ncbi:MAG: glycosyltransferase [Candidatus Omnitrophica bacterium]|nr:glycosyltransferase [Candidatus Omnitrophota bacterium]